VGQRSHGRQGRRDLAGAAATALAQELPRPAIREYLSAEQLAKVTPWSISAIEKMVSRGILKRDVHCPGNHGSAGKRLSGHTRSANRSLRQALVESARGAVRKRNSYLAAQYRRLVKRRGDKKAIVAVAHSILVIAYHVLRDSQSYRELGGDYFDRLNTDRLTRYHTKRLAALGYTVTLAKHAA
jgi:hypothetical protein